MVQVAYGLTPAAWGHMDAASMNTSFSARFGSSSKFHTVRQNHGNLIAIKTPEAEGEEIADACILLCNTLHDTWTGVGVKVADCVPVICFSPDGKVVAAIHAGWKGIRKDIVAKTFIILEQYAPINTYRIYLGPHQRLCCYRVHHSMYEEWRAAHGIETTRVQNNQRYVDLTTTIYKQLWRVGVNVKYIHDDGVCTGCVYPRYFSHRRSGGAKGRSLGFVAVKKV